MNIFQCNKRILLQITLLIAAFCYYLFFSNKGLVFFDEGYFVHAAERIYQGQIPYRDFSLQYGPTFFYILAFLYKIFGVSILVGRFFCIVICLGILATTFGILNRLKIHSYVIIFLSFLSLISFGYPLINIPNIMWANVLVAVLFALVYICWRASSHNYRYLLGMGALLALSLSLKQNFGVVLLLTACLHVIFGKASTCLQKGKNIFTMLASFSLLTFVWIYLFFLRNNLQGLWDIFAYSRRFAQTTLFTYPPLSMLLQPTGIFKLLPYYLPIILGVIITQQLFKKSRNTNLIALGSIVVTGFAVSVYPQSDLLHCYPFFGLVLVSLLLVGYSSRFKFLTMAVVMITCLVGFYLTFFTRSYRYEGYYSQENTPLLLPRTQGIHIVKTDAENINYVAQFINLHTKSGDYIFAYPDAPMLYVILDRPNPSKDPIYFLPNWHFYSDKFIYSELQQKKVNYIITKGAYQNDSLLSSFIQQQKIVFRAGDMIIFSQIDYTTKINARE